MSLIFVDEEQKLFKAPIELWNLIIHDYFKIEPTQPPTIARTSFKVLKKALSLTSKRFHQLISTLTRNIKVDPAPLVKGSVVSYCCLNDYASLLRYAIDNGAHIKLTAVDEAAKNGSLECLKVLEERGWTISQKNKAMNEASRHAHMHIVKYLVQRKVALKGKIISAAVTSGSIELVKYFQSLNAIKTYKSLGYNAALSGNLSLVKFIEQYTPLDQSCMIASAQGGSVEVLQYLLDKGFSWRQDLCFIAIEKRHVEYARHAFFHGPTLSDFDLYRLKKHLVKNNHLEFLKELQWVKNPSDGQFLKWAIHNRNFEVFKYLVDNVQLQSIGMIIKKCYDGCANIFGYQDLMPVFSYASEFNLIEYVKCMVEHGAPIPFEALTHAIEYNTRRTDMIAYLMDHGAPYHADLIDDVKGIDIVQCLHERGCQWTTRTIANAARRCDLKMVQYLHENGCPWQEDRIIDGSIDYFQVWTSVIPIIEYLREHGCQWSANTCAIIASVYDSTQILQFLHEHGCPWDERTCAEAAKNEHINCLKYALDNGCPYDSATMDNAVRSGSLETVKFLHERGIPWNDDSCHIMVEFGHIEMLQYAADNGAKWINESSVVDLESSDPELIALQLEAYKYSK